MTLHSQGGAGAPRTLATVAADAGRGLPSGFPPRLCDKSFPNNQQQKE
jgi:hypothetical protein